MSRAIVFTSDAPQPPPHDSQAVKAAGSVFVSGTAPLDPGIGPIAGETIQQQTRQCRTTSPAILRAAGTSLEKIVSAPVMLVDHDDFTGMNEA